MSANRAQLLPAVLGAGMVVQLSLACATHSDDAAHDRLPAGSQWLSGHDPSDILQSVYCDTPQPGQPALRRLSNLEYRNTLVDLGFDSAAVDMVVATLPREPESLGFRNAASALSVTSLLAEKYRTITEKLTATYDYPCQLDDESACADEMILRAGSRIYRRPLTKKEGETYRALYDRARTQDSHQDAMGWVARAMLQSPHFLYRVEIPDQESVAPVRGYEMASRLSYMLWHSSPDEELRRAARDGELEDEAQVLAQVYRMLQDPRAKSVLEFFEQWLDLDDLQEVERDGTAYAGISPQLPELLKAEAHAFLLHLLRTPGASYRDLLSADFTFANAELAEHYGLSAVEGDAFMRVPAPGRSGVLSQGMLVAQDGPTRTSIVRRGLKIRTDFLCQTVPAPPDTVDLTLDGIGETLTQSQRLALHSENASCRSCHHLIDPIGVAFEGFDAVGRQRSADEYGNPVDPAGELTNTFDANGSLMGVQDLAARLSGSVEAQECYMIQNLRFYLGREVQAEDLCTQAQVFSSWRESEFSLVGLLTAIVHSDAFLYKAKRQEQPINGSDKDDKGVQQ